MRMTPVRRSLALLALGIGLGIGLGACRTPPPEVAAPPRPTRSDSRDEADARETAAPEAPLPPVAHAPPPSATPPLPAVSDTGNSDLFRVGERGVSTHDLAEFLLRYFPERAEDALSQLLEEALVEAEAAREGLAVDPILVKARADAYVEQRRKAARMEYGAEADLGALLEKKFGRSLEEYRQDAERLARSAILRERLVRLDQLRHDGVEIRALVLRTESGARSAAERLRQGADMALLARRLGVRPPIARTRTRGEVSDTDLFAAMYAMRPGEVVEPRSFEGPAKRGSSEVRTWWQVVKVVRRWRGDDRPWRELRSQVLIGEELREGELRPGELLQWRRRALARHRVERRGPAGTLVPWVQPTEE